eukprot:sb/3475417/
MSKKGGRRPTTIDKPDEEVLENLKNGFTKLRETPKFQEYVEAKKMRDNNGETTLPIPVSLRWHEIQEYERAFKDFDQNGDGIITVDELPDVLDSIGLKPSPEEVEVDILLKPHAIVQCVYQLIEDVS